MKRRCWQSRGETINSNTLLSYLRIDLIFFLFIIYRRQKLLHLTVWKEKFVKCWTKFERSFKLDDEDHFKTGVLCGLGFKPVTNTSLYPDHDMDIGFDVQISTEDLVRVCSCATHSSSSISFLFDRSMKFVNKWIWPCLVANRPATQRFNPISSTSDNDRVTKVALFFVEVVLNSWTDYSKQNNHWTEIVTLEHFDGIR